MAPRAGSPTLEVVVSDGTGEAVAVFTGRRRIGGVDHGRGMLLEGVAHHERGRLVVLNPAYTLLAGTGLSRTALSADHAPVRMWRTSSSESSVTSTITSSPTAHDGVAPGHDHPAGPHDGHHGGVAGQAELLDLLVGGRLTCRRA